MAVAADSALFLASLGVTLAAAAYFARRLDRLGLRLGLPETLLGLLTALAADAPELSSAVTALAKGERGVGAGVVVGSNVFNLAAMIGLSAVVCGRVRLRRESVVIEGSVALALTVLVGALVGRLIGPVLALALVSAVAFPYVLLLALGPRGVSLVPVARRWAVGLRHAFGEPHRPEPHRHLVGEAVLLPALLLVPAVAIIVAGSIGMVDAAVSLGHRWKVPQLLVGTLVLGVVTSVPNAFTAVRLGLQGRGSALFSEAMNSNSINLVGGLAIPALFLTLDRLSALGVFDFAWLFATTLVALGVVARSSGAGRRTGFLLIALYAVFVVVQLAVAVG